jgi:hypothetical protein
VHIASLIGAGACSTRGNLDGERITRRAAATVSVHAGFGKLVRFVGHSETTRCRRHDQPATGVGRLGKPIGTKALAVGAPPPREIHHAGWMPWLRVRLTVTNILVTAVLAIFL